MKPALPNLYNPPHSCSCSGSGLTQGHVGSLSSGSLTARFRHHGDHRLNLSLGSYDCSALAMPGWLLCCDKRPLEAWRPLDLSQWPAKWETPRAETGLLRPDTLTPIQLVLPSFALACIA